VSIEGRDWLRLKKACRPADACTSNRIKIIAPLPISADAEKCSTIYAQLAVKKFCIIKHMKNQRPDIDVFKSIKLSQNFRYTITFFIESREGL
jgi:hypothetical protein